MVNMQLLAGILALLLFLCLVPHCIGDKSREMIVVFKGNHTDVLYDNNNKTITMRKPLAFRVPAFVGGVFNNKEFLAVFCNVRYDGFSDWSFIEAAARTSYGDFNKWSDAVIFAQNTRKHTKFSMMDDITSVMKGNKIFVLASSWDKSRESWVKHSSNKGWDILMIVGTVVIPDESTGGSASIKWEQGTSLKSLLPKTVNLEKGSQFIGGVGNGMVTKNGTIVFPIQISNIYKDVAASIMYSTDDGKTWQIGGTTPNGPSEGSVVEWNDGKLILNTRYDKGARIVHESNNMGKTWKESLIFSRVWGNQPFRTGVGSQGSAITAPVDGKNVLLFLHPLNKKGGYTRDTLQLWMSDGQRIKCVGTISEKGKGERSGNSILAQVGNSLYSMHEINPYRDWDNYNAPLKEWDRVIALSPLPHFYEIIKNTVRSWRQLDEWLQNKGIPTDGLVGFLGNTVDEKVWTDMYNCVNATVSNGKSISGGFRFENAGSGAKWPVMDQGQNYFYIFAKKQFTLAATVIIHNASWDKDVFILGAASGFQRDPVVFGLGYTKDQHWCGMQSYNKITATEALLVLEEEYHVAITFANGVAFLYVDGLSITKGELNFYSALPIRHFFIGGIGLSASTKNGNSCTVKNAMLFNRALSETEIIKLSKAKKDKLLYKPTTKITEKFTVEPGNLQPLSKEEHKATLASIQEKEINEKANDNNVINSMQEYRDAVLNKNTEGNNVSVVLLLDIAWMCIVCSFIAITGFQTKLLHTIYL